jgi:hypothetical protein
VWPLLMFLSWRGGVRIGAFMTIALIVSFMINIDHVQWDPVGTFFGLPTRLWELAMGGILASASRHPATAKVDAILNKMLFDPLRPVLTEADFKAALGVALIVIMTFTPIKQQLFPGWSAVYPTMGALLVIWAGPTAWINRSALGSRGFVALGLISYPLYLWHWPLLSFARIVESAEPSAALKGAAIVLALVLAALTYLAVEKPIRTRPHGITAPALAIVLALTGAAGFGVLAKNGLPSRVANIDNIGQFDWPQLFDLAPGRKDDANMDVSCKNELFGGTEVNYCKRTSRDTPADRAERKRPARLRRSEFPELHGEVCARAARHAGTPATGRQARGVCLRHPDPRFRSQGLRQAAASAAGRRGAQDALRHPAEAVRGAHDVPSQDRRLGAEGLPRGQGL